MRKLYPLLFLYCISYGGLVANAQSFQRTIDSLQAVYTSIDIDDQRLQIDLLNEIAYAYRRMSPDSILRYATLAITSADNIDYREGLAFAYKNKGIAFYKMGAPPDTVTAVYQMAIDYAKEVNDYYTQAACYNNIGLIKSFGLGFYNEAAQYFLQGLAVFNEHIPEENRLKALILANIGTAYHRDGDNKKGIQYYEQALAMAERLGELSIPSIYADELARARMEEGDTEGALRDITKLMPLHDQLGDYESKAESLVTLAEVKMKLNQYDQAILHAREALAVTEEYGFPQRKSVALVQLALGLRANGQTNEAIEHAELALAKKGSGMALARQIQATALLAEVYAEQGNYAAAYKNAALYNDILNEEQDVNKQRISDELEAKYRNEEQFRKIEVLTKEQEAQRTRLYQLIGLVLVFILLSAIMVYIVNQKNKATAALSEKNDALQRAEQKLNEKNQQLERYIESNLQLENFAHLASHDLREPMRNIVSFSQLLAKSGQSKLNEQELEYLDFIQQGTGRIEGLVQDLLAYSTITHSPLSLSTFSIAELIQEVKTDISQILQEKGGTLEIGQIPAHITADRSRMYQLLQNLFTNAMRYSREDVQPTIIFEGEETNDHYRFKVSDNGIGIAADFYEQIFVLFKTLDSKSKTNSSGIGLATCRKVAEDHGGRIWVESKKGKGSTFFFTIAKQLLD